MSSSLFDSAINWIRKGYPEGIPPTDFPPLLALLMRTLSEEEVTNVALVLAKEGSSDSPVTPERIKQAILEVTEAQPTDAEINQVAARLAAVGWPLAASPATA
ncbi:protein of unknown function DUF3349 [Gordonia polyisoprenivorans VH2]|uniref:DUF3349 domain-containing protein n=1 Tax=Gordonia polyisoprenivorans (strain DSM 44266 / VH2) TaxID=1112204 RepID=H6N1I1_GORPV|nr:MULTISPECIES: DUF3349 domain-containing protein [Gordonia]AFA72192.1 protein of unknown function DUF3349 [Gordonia polyisoprenivorans VH2]MDF3284075.1 DUF3349 domain-containing protein [Gordonia sp. N1V]OPX07671.1 hypothetical protein B1964_27400 [Gordonia sp. i37]